MNKKIKQRGGNIPNKSSKVAVVPEGTVSQGETKSTFLMIRKPYTWALMVWVMMLLLRWIGLAIPLWILYLSAIPFCMGIILHYFQEYKRKRNESTVSPELLNIGMNTLTSASPAFFLLIQLILLIFIYISKEDIIANHSKIPENFTLFQNLINVFLLGQIILILRYMQKPKDINKMGLWFVMSCTITATLACMHYIWIILTKLITDG